ncbi:MAG: hypothetical protein IRZ00_00175 [Gemmatimonadetes bacterium]|nr:hypothetical protein [Gemmatimonadota bacterium]
MKSPRSWALRGGFAGILAATALALWFLVVDSVEGRPFHTPAFLASVVLGHATNLDSGPAVALYTVVHYVAFAGLGVGVALAVRGAHRIPTVLLGALLGFLLFDLLFYGGVVLTGVDVVRALGWPEVLVGNTLAGLVLMVTLRWESGAEPIGLHELLAHHRIVREGLVAGVAAAIAVALWFLIVDTIRGRVLFTPAALGSALFYGARGVGEVRMTLITVLGYTALHFVAFAIAGLLAATLATEAEREPPLVLAFALLFVTFEALFIGLLAIAANWLLDALSWSMIAVANLLATLVIGGYLWREHPDLRRALREEGFEIERPV